MTEALRKPEPQEQSPDDAQRQASDPKTSVWVNASAGSGKTTVLTKRVTRLLLDGVPPEKILCLTYTRAAAAEMANRVTKQLAKWATCGDKELDEDIDDLQKAPIKDGQRDMARRLFAHVLSCAGGMRIRTIHAFCQEILRRFPIEAGLPPHFAVIEEADANALQEDVLRDLLRAATNAPDGALNTALTVLVQDLGEKGFHDAMRGILKERARLQTSMAQAGGLDNLVAQMRAELALAPDETIASIIASASDPADYPEADIKRAAQALLQGLETSRDIGAGIMEFLALPADRRGVGFITYKNFYFTLKGEPRKRLADKKTLTVLPQAETILAREVLRLQGITERLDAAQLAENTRAVLVFGDALIRRYEARKTAQAALDFDDLIIRTAGLLRRANIAPWVLFKLDGGIDHILVDEAQDTSRAQWDIVAALAEEFFAGQGAKTINRTLFVVGDEKQSIFSFQNADPEAFAAMRQYFGQRINAAGKIYDEVPMRTSFRSARTVLQAVDAVFATDAARSGVSVEPVEHRPSKADKQGRVEVWPLLQEPEKEKDEAGEWVLPLGYVPEYDTQVELAKSIASKIAGWITRKEILPGTDKPVTAGDIMILLRRRGRFADIMVRALKAVEVAVTGVDRMKLVVQLPVMDLLALMQFALLPEDDLNLATVLRGPLLGLSEEQLMELAIGRKENLWRSLSDKAAVHPDFTTAHAYLAAWLNEADFISPFTMLARVLNESCPANNISGRRAIWSRLGPDALDPIDELLNAAQDFSRRHAPSLQSFLHWLMATETQIKREMDRSGGKVRIMTVHAAKGLEAPIVFMPDTASLPRAQDVPAFLWNADGVPFYTPRRPEGGLARRLWDEARQKQLEEYRRLLYVALTRAENQLYIGGWQPAQNEGNAEESWYNLIASVLKPLHEPHAVQTDGPPPEIAFADPELKRAAPKPVAEKSAAPVALPGWARQPVPDESVRLKTVAPSQFVQQPATATPDANFARGRIIHRLLQSLPDMDDAQRDNAAARFLANPQHRLTPDQQDKIKAEVLGLIRNPEYAPLFGAGSRAEVSLAGQLGDRFIAGQVDRLCVRDNGVWIVDYKTNRPPPTAAKDIPEPYRLQMAQYRAVLQAIYPGKPVSCYLLWTYGGTLMPVPEGMLMP